MSIAAVHAFRALLETKPELQKSVSQALAAGNIQSVIDAGAVWGHMFTVQDLQACVDAGELSDQELELVAGGGQQGTNMPKVTTPPRSAG